MAAHAWRLQPHDRSQIEASDKPWSGRFRITLQPQSERPVLWKGSGNLLTLWEELDGGHLEPTTFHMPAPLADSPAVMLAELHEPMRAAQTVIVCAGATTQGTLVRWAVAINLLADGAQRCIGYGADGPEASNPILSFSSVQVVEAGEPGQIVAAAWASPALCLVGLSDGQLKRVHYQSTHSRPDADARPASVPVLVPAARVQVTPISTSMSAQLWAMFVGGASSAVVRAMATVPLLVQGHTRTIVSVQADGTLQVWDAETGAAGFSSPLQKVLGSLTGEFDAHEARIISVLPMEQQGCPWLASTSSQCLIMLQLRLSDGWQRPWLLRLTLGSGGVLRAGAVTVTAVHPDPDNHFWCTSEEQNPAELDGAALHAAALKPSSSDGDHLQLLTMWLASDSEACRTHAWQHVVSRASSPLLCTSPAWTSQAMLAHAATQHSLLQRLPASSACTPVAQAVLGSVAAAAVTIQDDMARKPPTELPGPDELVMPLTMPLQWVHDAAAPDAPHAISQVLHAPAAQIVPAGLAAVLQSDDCVRLQSAVWTARWGMDAAVLSALDLPTSSAGAQWQRGPSNRLVAATPKLQALHTERRAAGPGIVVLAHALTAAARLAGDSAAHACVLIRCPYDMVCGVLHGAAARAACHEHAQAGCTLVALAAFAALPASTWLEHAGLVSLLRAVDVGSAAAVVCAVVHEASESLGAAEQPASLRLALAPLQRDQDSNLLDAAPTAAARAMIGAALHSAALGWLEFHASLARGLSAHAAGMQLVPLAQHAGLSLLGAPQPLAALEPAPQQLSEAELAQAMWALLPPRVQAALARTQAREALPVLQRSLDAVASNLDALWLRAAQVLHCIAQATVDSSAEDSSVVNPAKAITAIASATMLLLPHRFGAMHVQVDAFSEAAAAFAAQPADPALATALLHRLLQLSAAHDAPLVDEQHWVSAASQQSGPWWHCAGLGGPPAWLAIAAVQWMTRCADQHTSASSLPTAWAVRCVMRLVCTAVQLLLPATASALPAWVSAAADAAADAGECSADSSACPAESAAALACCSMAALHAALLCRARAAGLWWTRATSSHTVQALNMTLNPQVFAGRRSDATWINAAGGADCAEHTLDPLAAPAAAQIQLHTPDQGSETAQACATAATVLDAIGSAASVLVFSQGAGSARSEAGGAAPVPALSSSSLAWGCDATQAHAQPGTLQPALLMSAMLTLRAQCAVQLEVAPHCAWPPVLRAALAQQVPPMLLVAYADSCAALQPVLVPDHVLTAAQLVAAHAQLYARMLAAQQLGFSSSPAALELAQECVSIAAAAASAMSQAAQHASVAAQAATQGAVQASNVLVQQLATAGLCSADGRVSRAQARAIVLGASVDTALPSVAVPASAVSSHWLLYAGSAAADAACMASTALLLSAPNAPESTAQQRRDLYSSTHQLQTAAQQLLHAAACEPVPLAWDAAWPAATPHVTLADVSSEAGSPVSVTAGAVRLAGLSLTGSIDAFLTACAARACAAAAAGTEEVAEVLAPAQALAVSPSLWTARYGPCLALAHALAWCSHASSTAQAILTGMSSSHGYSVQAAAAAALLHEATPGTQLHTSAMTQALYKATAAGMIAPCTHLLGHLPRTVPLAGSALAEAMLSAVMGIVQDVALEARALKRAWRRLPEGRTHELAGQCQSMATSALRAHALCETVGVHVPVHSPEYAPLFMASGVAHVAAAALHAAVASPQAPALTAQLAVPCALAALAQLCDDAGSSSRSTASCRTQPAALEYVRGVLREHLGSTGNAVASCLQASCVRIGDAMPASAGAVLGCVAAVTVGRVHEACTALLRFAREDVVHAAPVVTLSVAGIAALAVAIPVALAGPVGLGAQLSSEDDGSFDLEDKAGLPAGLVVEWGALTQALACLDSAAAGWPAHLSALHACFVSVPGVEPPAPLLQALCKLRPDIAAVRCAEAGCLQSALYAATLCVPQHKQGTVQYTAAARGGPAAPQLSALRVWSAGATVIAPGTAPSGLPEFAAHAGPVGGGSLACPAWIPWRTVSRVLMAAAQQQVNVQAAQTLRGIEASMQAHMSTTASTSNQAAAVEVRAADSASTH